MCFLLMGSLMYAENIALAAEKDTGRDIAELSEEEKMVVVMIGNLKNSYGRNLKVGDFVKYRIREDEERDMSDMPEIELEIKVYKKENDAFWIVERSIQEKKAIQELHFLIDFKNMKILELYSLYYGEKEELPIPIMDEKEASRICKQYKDNIKQAMEMGTIMPMPTFKFKKAAKSKDIKVPAGSFNCVCLEPKLLAEQTKKMSSEEVEEWKNQSAFYFNKGVPKLIPFSLIYAMMQAGDPDILGKVQSGLVKYYSYELIDYNK